MTNMMAIANEVPCKKDLKIVNKGKCKDCPSFGSYGTIKTAVDPKDSSKGYESRVSVHCNYSGPSGIDGQQAFDHLCTVFYGTPYEPPSERDDGAEDVPDDEKTARERVTHPFYRNPDSPDN